MRAPRDGEAVLTQIRSWAQTRDNVRAVVLNGSRADPGRPPDALSDFDLAVLVRTVKPVVANDSWLEPFGPIMVRWPRRPQPTASATWVTQLVLFADGVRIDFQFSEKARIEAADLDPWYRVLVDKDGLGRDLPPPPLPRPPFGPPTRAAFAGRLNAFWWDIVYVAKGLWRGELNYAKAMLDGTVRFDMVVPLLAWKVGLDHGWQVDVGIHGRWLDRLLEPRLWEHYLRTFAATDVAANWRAMFATCELVRTVGSELAEAFGHDYPGVTDAAVTRYLSELHGDAV